jgi:hypothetical protein
MAVTSEDCLAWRPTTPPTALQSNNPCTHLHSNLYSPLGPIYNTKYTSWDSHLNSLPLNKVEVHQVVRQVEPLPHHNMASRNNRNRSNLMLRRRELPLHLPTGEFTVYCVNPA